MHLNHRLSICESVLKKFTHVGSTSLDRVNLPLIVPSIFWKRKKVNTMYIFFNEKPRYAFKEPQWKSSHFLQNVKTHYRAQRGIQIRVSKLFWEWSIVFVSEANILLMAPNGTVACQSLYTTFKWALLRGKKKAR